MNKTSKYLTVISPTLNILSIEKGGSIFFPDNKIKKSVIRATIVRLNKKGYNFSASEAGIDGGIIVTNNSSKHDE